MNIKFLIPVKRISVRVRDKNIRPFCGSNLLELKIEQLKRLFPAHDIVVNTESDEIISIAKKHGVETIKRDEYYTRGDVPMSEAYKNFAENLDCEYVAYINATNPLVRDNTYKHAVKTFTENLEYNLYDSLVSCHEIKEFMWLDNKPINYNPMKQGRSQDLPNIVALNFAISIISRKDMIRFRNIIGEKPYFFKVDPAEALDIDTPLDFFIAEKLYEVVGLNEKIQDILL